MKTIGEMTAEIRKVNFDRGWRKAEGGPGDNTFGDYLALLHSAISKALDAYLDHRLADATRPPACVDSRCDRFMSSNPRPGDVHFGLVAPCPQGHLRERKPEGVGSELADVLIRLLDMADVYGYTPFDTDCEIGDVDPEFPVVIRHIRDAGESPSFGDWVRALHDAVVDVGHSPTIYFPHLLRQLVCFAEAHGIDLNAEYERKIAFNRTRPLRHGNKSM